MSQYQRRFGVTAIEKGFITIDQLEEAFKVQVLEEIKENKHRLIGVILFEQGLMTLAQIDDVLQSLQTLSAF
jgi:hypothetical protein